MKASKEQDIPVGTRALILSKRYYGVLTRSLEDLDIERYYSILYFLYSNPACSQQEICNNLAIGKTAMVKVLDYLIDAGYIKRQVNPDDRREHFISLTAKGSKKTAGIVRSFKAIDEQMFSGISKSQRSVFIKTMARLSSNLAGLPADQLFFEYKNDSKKTTGNK